MRTEIPQSKNLCVMSTARVQQIVRGFNNDWKRALEVINQDVMRAFTNFKNGQQILQVSGVPVCCQWEIPAGEGCAGMLWWGIPAGGRVQCCGRGFHRQVLNTEVEVLCGGNPGFPACLVLTLT